ncbi:MAG: Dyp-type peroxidase [Oscillatoriales cyanobacterium RU_3_3]|nr:Dyp-type peroxidase [Oscillatoriales cyanobacterium RU_3_3]
MSELINEPILEMGEIQGNIFPGFMKNYQTLLGLKILNEPENIRLAKAWIASITPEIATAAEVFKFKELRNLMIDRRGYLSGKLAVCWINIAFSAQGLKKLLANPTEVDRFADQGFKRGLPARATDIGDPDDILNLEGSPKNWRIGGTPETIPDIFLIIASDLPTQLEATVEQIKKSLKQAPTSVDKSAITSGLEIIYEESGENLPGELSGHEHFGFKDGISQPGIRGRVSEAPDSFLTPRYIDPKDELSQTFSKPGQPLVWPGQFVFGYRAQSDLKPTESVPSKPAPTWAKNGSFLVFRRLRQDVGSFWNFMHSKAKELATEDGFSDLDGERLAALLVGRWKSGAPIMRTPDRDNNQLSKDDSANNHFNFDQKSRQIPLIPGQPDDGYELAPEDRDGFRCPHAAHIRKVNPRDITTEKGSNTDTLTRRILRRGIPFGKVLDDPNNPDADPLQGNRGLFFLSYQTSIEDQFEFLSKNWMNGEKTPEENPGGKDLIVGQNNNLGQNRKRRCTIRRKVDGQTKEAIIESETDWVIPTGGGYFFSPSITALKDILGAS